MKKTYIAMLALGLALSLSANVLLYQEIQYLKEKREGQAKIIIELMERNGDLWEEIGKLQDKLCKYESCNDTWIATDVHHEGICDMEHWDLQVNPDFECLHIDPDLHNHIGYWFLDDHLGDKEETT